MLEAVDVSAGPFKQVSSIKRSSRRDSSSYQESSWTARDRRFAEAVEVRLRGKAAGRWRGRSLL